MLLLLMLQIAYVSEFTRTSLHVEMTVLEDNIKRGQPNTPKEGDFLVDRLLVRTELWLAEG